MKVSLAWLAEYLDLPTTDRREITRALDMLGETVESVEEHTVGWTGVDIARVESVAPHPDADKVRVCTVTLGAEPITVICGAWNFEAGDIVAFASPGAILPGDFEIGVRSIRGVDSYGMICSESELGLGDDHDGILVLDQDSPIGAPLQSVLELPDLVFELEITPNRPDAMSMVGIARELAAWFEVPYRIPDPTPPMEDADPGIGVRIDDPDGNPRFTARRVDGVTVGPSPLWMRQRLRKVGVRPISNLVDITNYVMMELGQPLHVFDLDRLAGDELVVRRAEEGEHLTTLDGQDRTLTTEDLVICDADGPTSLAGTMGGEGSEVSESTTSTLIEAATWHPPTVMHMSRRHGLRSEASARFERGVDPTLPPRASLRAAELAVRTAGGSLRSGFVDEIARAFEPTIIVLEPAYVQRLLGSRFDPDTIASLLERLGFDVRPGSTLSVTVPAFRPDVVRPVDLVEEVARLADFDTFESRLRTGEAGGLTVSQRRAGRVRALLADMGYTQTVALSFVMPAELESFHAPDDDPINATIEVKNPLSAEEAVLRTTMLPGVLRALRHNRNRGHLDVAAFEIGRVFHAVPWSEDPRVPSQPQRLAFAVMGRAGASELDGRARPADVFTATGTITALADAMRLDVELAEASAPGFHPTRTAAIVAAGSVIGHVGELHPLTAEAFELTGRIAAAEFDLDAFLRAHLDTDYRPVSAFPPVDFDLSFETPIEAPSTAVAAAAAAGAGDLLEAISLFDEFTGGSLPEGRKALAYRVRLRASDRTLDAAEIARVREAMIEGASSVGGSLRGA